MSKVTNILIVGVGGQGTILASKVIGSVASQIAKEVKLSEIHGMSQRGGSVVTQVRFGEKVYAPVIALGEADVILAFEKLEALRWLPYLKKDGLMIVNDQEMDPMPVVMGKAKYPDNIYEVLQSNSKLIRVDALNMAKECGSIKAVNVVLLGVLAKHLEQDKATWLEAVRSSVPPKTREINEKAFNLGCS